MVENNQLQAILAIFQSLITTRANEIYGFELLESVVANFTPSVDLNRVLTDVLTVCRSTIGVYFTTILQLLFTRLQNSKTDAFTSRFVRLYHFVSARVGSGLGADWFIKHANQVQDG